MDTILSTKIRKNVSFNQLVDVKEFDEEEDSTQIHTMENQKIKEIDGLSLVSFIIDDIIYNYFNVHNIKTIYDVEESLHKSFEMFISINPDTTDVLDKESIICVKNMIQLTCDKINEKNLQEPNGGVFIIRTGGGRGNKLCKIHIPHIQKLISLINEFIENIE
jgi:hypothetical protein